MLVNILEIRPTTSIIKKLRTAKTMISEISLALFTSWSPLNWRASYETIMALKLYLVFCLSADYELFKYFVELVSCNHIQEAQTKPFKDKGFRT